MGYGLVVVGCGKRTCMEWTYGAKDNISTNSVLLWFCGPLLLLQDRLRSEVHALHIEFHLFSCPPLFKHPFFWKLKALRSA